MTERKPAGVTFESWVERQLREARERGSFDGLPGTGKPLPATASDELSWVREKVRREDLPVSALLPPALAVAKEVEDLPARLARERSEPRVRALLDDLNQRIDAARRGPQVGPPVRTALVDVGAAVAAWREAVTPPPPGVAPASATPPPRRRWWRRSRRGQDTVVDDAFSLQRFVDAQDSDGTYDAALAELRAGRKRTHWMWFVFPQLAGLGRSATAQHYAVRSLDEARAYAGHPVLGPRLVDCARALVELGGSDAAAVLGPVDAHKLRSSMTLFAAAAPDVQVFRDVLGQYYAGVPDDATARLLAAG